MQRIVILGNSGSGKSTLARLIGTRLSLPVVHLDTLFWEPEWVEPDPEEFRKRVRNAVVSDAWVCEGNYYRRTFDLRLPRADLIVWLDTPRVICITRVVVRSILNRPRADLPVGCSEKLDRKFLGFLRYVWNFDHQYRPSMESAQLAVGPQVPVVHLQGEREVADFLDSLPSRL